MTSQAEEQLDLVRLDRALRPLRRVLARGAAERAATDPWFAASCARLAGGLSAIGPVPPPLDDDLRELAGQFEGIAEADGPDRADRLARAWQVLLRVDAALGLPLEVAPPRPRVRLLAAPEPEPERPTPAAPAAPVAPAVTDEEAPALRGARWDTPLADLDLPDALVDAAADAGIETVWDALSVRPLEAEALSPVHGAGRELPEGRVAVGGRVRARFTRLRVDGAEVSAVSEVVLHGAGRLHVTWDGTLSSADLHCTVPGSKAVVVGRHEDGRLVEGRLATAWHGRAVRTRYGGAAPSHGELARLLLEGVDELEEPLPPSALARHGLRRLPEAVAAAHTRLGDEEARRRLAFEEALHVALGLSFGRFEGAQDPGIGHLVVHHHVAELQTRDGRPALDDAAQAALETIKRDLRSTAPMQRLLLGHPGVDDVALHALLTVAESRAQVLVTAPDAPSAAVLYGRWSDTLRAFGLVPLLVAGEPSRSDRDALRRGELHVVFAAPSVFEHALDWRRLGLVLAFEQARYGEVPLRVRALRSPRPDLLVVARTPLPASVLLGAYPTLDVVALPPSAEPPAGGTVWREPEREAAWRALGEARRAGRPLLVAFPMRRGGTDLLTLREVDGLVATLRAQVLDGARVAVFHGALQPRERLRAWVDFVERRADVLVATTTIELMGPFPRGVVGLVEHADRMDPQRLLGVRSMVTSTGHLHYVVSAEPDPAGTARVARLADKAPDAEIVVDGDVFEPVEACGLAPVPAWHWLDPARDVPLLLAAREQAHAILRADPGLRQGARQARTTVGAWHRLLPDVPCPVPAREAPAGRKRRRRRRR